MIGVAPLLYLRDVPRSGVYVVRQFLVSGFKIRKVSYNKRSLFHVYCRFTPNEQRDGSRVHMPIMVGPCHKDSQN